MLSALCVISISPDSCVRQNEASFARRGVLTLVIAKFVPGLSILAPPLAGALGMPARRFLAWNLLGSALWAGVVIGVGWLFHEQIDALLRALSRWGGVAVLLAGAALLGYPEEIRCDVMANGNAAVGVRFRVGDSRSPSVIYNEEIKCRMPTPRNAFKARCTVRSSQLAYSPRVSLLGNTLPPSSDA